jgi:hypothetical protein
MSKNIPKNSFLSTFMGFMGPKPHFYGSHKPQNEFVKQCIPYINKILLKNNTFIYKNVQKYSKIS